MCWQVRVQLSAALKQKLLDDWDRIQSGAIEPLPRKPSVNDIMLQFVDACKSNKDLVEPEEEVGMTSDPQQKHASTYTFSEAAHLAQSKGTRDQGSTIKVLCV